MLLTSIVAGLLMAETPDSLQAAAVVADRSVVVSRVDTVRILNSVSFSDAFAGIPGLYVSDYGGLAGSKNVSLRGMGSPHASIYLDGVRVGNVQSGQVDMGVLDLGNIGGALIDYAQNSLSFTTARPVFGSGKTGGTVRFRGGSFGTYEPSARLDFRLSEKLCLSAMVTGVVSKGDFPMEGGARRENNDIRQFRSGLDVWGIMDGGDWHAKGYFNGAERGTPGSLGWPLADRQRDCNAFVQGVVRKQFSPLYLLNLSGKAAYDRLNYSSEYGDSRYSLTEAQLNTAHKFSTGGWFDAGLSADISWDRLESEFYSGNRVSLFSSVGVCFHPGRFKADVALEYSGTFEGSGENSSIVSPSVDMRWNVFRGLDLLAFARRSYRHPTFNELYYPGFGNADLKPEDAWLTDIGIEYGCSRGKAFRLQAGADAFFNYLKDKIVSAPTDTDPNIWLPFNIGVVQVAGVDATLSFKYAGRGLKAAARARYSFQDALDKTPGSYSYRRPAPYISKHTLNLGADAAFRGWAADLTWTWRWGRFDADGRMPDYNTLDLSFGKDFQLPGALVLGLKLHSRNLCDCRYELTVGYPMPGRSFYGEIVFKF